jgi:hypothetical protein
MKTMKLFMHKNFLSIIIIVFMSILIGCGEEEINSTWLNRKIVINGIDNVQEWENALHHIKEKDITIGFLNDEDALYIRLSTRNMAIQQQVLTTGFTVWFDETGGNKRMYGIHFPLPPLNKDSHPERSHSPSGIHEEQTSSSGISNKLLQASQGDMEIIQPGKKEFSMIIPDYSSSDGIQCHMENIRDDFIYKLRVPLTRSNSQHYGIAMTKIRTIGIGFETGEIEHKHETTKGSGGRGRHGGGRGHGGNTGESPEGEGSSSGNHEMMKSINTWLKVNLAAKP